MVRIRFGCYNLRGLHTVMMGGKKKRINSMTQTCIYIWHGALRTRGHPIFKNSPFEAPNCQPAGRWPSQEDGDKVGIRLESLGCVLEIHYDIHEEESNRSHCLSRTSTSTVVVVETTRLAVVIDTASSTLMPPTLANLFDALNVVRDSRGGKYHARLSTIQVFSKVTEGKTIDTAI
jgi:hypothetical protein